MQEDNGYKMNKFHDTPIWLIPLEESYAELCKNSPLIELLGEENLLNKEWFGQELDDFQKHMLCVLREEIRRKSV